MRFDTMLQDIEQRFDELRRQMVSPWSETEEAAARMPATDVIEQENEYVVTAELPGFDKADVTLEVDDDGVLIRARRDRTEERERRGGRVLRRERTSRAFERYVRLPEEVSPDGVRATFRNGVLEVSVPKTSPEKRRRRQIDIQ